MYVFSILPLINVSYFRILEAVNNAVLNAVVQVLFLFPLDIYTEMELLGHTVLLFLVF